MNAPVLEHYVRLYPKTGERKKLSLPLRLFRKLPLLQARKPETPLPLYEEDDKPVPFIKVMLKLFPDQVSVNAGYPLACAVRAGHTPLIRLLLQAGADPLFPLPPKNHTAVHLAIILRSLSLVKLLLETGRTFYFRGAEVTESRKIDQDSLICNMLDTAYMSGCPDIAVFLTQEMGMIPTITILKWLAEGPERRRRTRRAGR